MGSNPDPSQMMWVRFFDRLWGIHSQVALQRLLLAALQYNLRRQRARARLVREQAYHLRPVLHFPKSRSSTLVERSLAW